MDRRSLFKVFGGLASLPMVGKAKAADPVLPVTEGGVVHGQFGQYSGYGGGFRTTSSGYNLWRWDYDLGEHDDQS